MTSYWCVNFETEDILQHGLSRNLWLTQYQYEHAGFDFQGNDSQKARTTITWKVLRAVAIGDWLVAYLPNSTFYAVGQVVEPRVLSGDLQRSKTDTVQRTLSEQRHLHFDGVVRYVDAPALYEDFTDTFRVPTDGRSGFPAFFAYSQRIDVAKWTDIYRWGMTMPGLSIAAPLPLYRQSIFPIPSEYFSDIRDNIKQLIAAENE